MLTVLELKGRSTLPQAFLDTLPTHCDTCGSELEITPSLSALSCPNRSCMDRAVQRLIALLKDIDVKNMGEAKCRQFLENFGVTNPYAIFMYEPSDGVLYPGCSMAFSEAIFEQVNARRSMALWEYVRAGNLPGIRDEAYKLVTGYGSLDDFYDDLEDGGIAFIQNLLGIKSAVDEDGEHVSVSVKASKIYTELIDHKEELFEALPFVTLPNAELPELNICMSSSVGGQWGKKEAFERYLKETYGDRVVVNVFKTVSGKCDALIWAGVGKPTGKVDKVLKANEKRRLANIENGVDEEDGLILLVDGQGFCDYIEANYT